MFVQKVSWHESKLMLIIVLSFKSIQIFWNKPVTFNMTINDLFVIFCLFYHKAIMTVINNFAPLNMKKKNSNRVGPWPKTQRGSAPSPAASPLHSARSADPSVSERLLLLARPSLNTKSRSWIATHRNPTPTTDRQAGLFINRQDIFRIGRMVLCT